MCSPSKDYDDCLCFRLTERHDLTGSKGLKRGMDVASLADFLKIPILVWISIPCTGGSSWQRINKGKGPVAQAKIEQHLELFNKLLPNAFKIAQAVILQGTGRVVFEWPDGCSYWQDPRVVTFISSNKLTQTKLDGCSYGLVSKFGKDVGKPIKKTWRLAHNFPHIGQLMGRKCKCSIDHAICQGRDTKVSENYTPELIEAIHYVFANHSMSTHTFTTAPCAPAISTPCARLCLSSNMAKSTPGARPKGGGSARGKAPQGGGGVVLPEGPDLISPQVAEASEASGSVSSGFTGADADVSSGFTGADVGSGSGSSRAAVTTGQGPGAKRGLKNSSVPVPTADVNHPNYGMTWYYKGKSYDPSLSRNKHGFFNGPHPGESGNLRLVAYVDWLTQHFPAETVILKQQSIYDYVTEELAISRARKVVADHLSMPPPALPVAGFRKVPKPPLMCTLAVRLIILIVSPLRARFFLRRRLSLSLLAAVLGLPERLLEAVCLGLRQDLPRQKLLIGRFRVLPPSVSRVTPPGGVPGLVELWIVFLSRLNPPMHRLRPE